MAGKTRPSLKEKTLQNVALSNLSLTDKQCIQSVFEKFEALSKADVVEEASCKGCISYDACSEWSVKPIDTLLKSCCHFKSKSDFVEVKHGEWFTLDNCANEGVYCSVCHKKVYKKCYANQKLKSKHCPNCGAEMDGKTEKTDI